MELSQNTESKSEAVSALHALYWATGGPEWVNSWDLEADIDKWWGVEINEDEGCVVSLSLENNNLRGSIPKELGDLTALTTLYLRCPNITGSIPKELGGLTALTTLYLRCCSITGSFPKELGDLTALTTLHLRCANITGSIPKELGGLTALTTLHMNCNSITGSIPKELGGLTALATLYLRCASITGSIPKELGDLTALTTLYLRCTNITGSIPNELGGLTVLTTLHLRCPEITGSIPKELGGLTALTTLDLDRLGITGSVPKELGGLTALTTLHVLCRSITGSIPKELGGLTALTALNINCYSITGSIPKELGDLTALTTLHLYCHNVTGSIPKELGGLTALTTLHLRCPEITGSIPKELGGLTALATLHLYCHNITGSIPNELGGLTTLTKLYLYGYNITGAFPKELGGLTALTTLHLDCYNITVAIPKELGDLTALTTLHLDCYSITGSIPKELGGLTTLTMLYLRCCSITGSIPKELGGLTALTTLHMNCNGITGSIPKELGGLTALTALHLDCNSITGSIPNELGGLTALTTLYLRCPNITGSIPNELGGLTALTTLHFDCYSITGSIPKELGGLTALTTLHLDCYNITGSIPKELGGLTALTTLYLRCTNITGQVPTELRNLQALQTLDLSGNKLSGLWDCGAYAEKRHAQGGTFADGEIPRELDEFLVFLGALHEFNTRDNPWGEPPAAVVGDSGNIPVVRSYFVDLYRGKRVVSRSLKVVLVGREGTGKTSLRQSITTGWAAPTAGPEDSTVHMNIQDTTLEGVSLRILDCGGQVAYYGLLQLFLTRRAVYLLVWDVSQEGSSETVTGGTTGDLEALGILPWLRALSFRLPDGDIILVGNKCDLRSRAQGSAIQAASRVESTCREWLARFSSSGGRAVMVEKVASLTSCARASWWRYVVSSMFWGLAEIAGYKRGWPCDWRTGRADEDRPPSLINRIIRKGPIDPVRAEKMVLPQGWDFALSFLGDLSGGERHSVPSTLAEDRVPSQETPSAEVRGMAREELLLEWRRTIEEEGLTVRNPESALEGALTIREYEGTVLSLGSYFFLDVGWLAKVLEPVLNHKGVEERGASRMFGNVELTEPWHGHSLRMLIENGILEPQLASFLWPGVTDHVLAALKQIGLTFPLPGDRDGALVVPLRLSKTRPRDVGQGLATMFPDDQISLAVTWKMHDGVPPGAIERIMSHCCYLGTAKVFWRFGILVRVDHDGEGSRLRLEYNTDKKELVVAVWGDLTKAVAWATICCVYTVVREMTLQFPGLRWEAFLGCPDHPAIIMGISEAQTRGDRLVDNRNICTDCHMAGEGAGILASELLEMDDINAPIGQVLQRVVGRISESQRARLNSCWNAGNTNSGAEVENFRTQVHSRANNETLKQILVELRELQSCRLTVDEVNNIVEKSQKTMVEIVAIVKDEVQEMRRLEPYRSPQLQGIARKLAGLTIRIPSHAVLLPPRQDESQVLTEDERREPNWTERLKTWYGEGKKVGKNMATKEFRLFFLCGHDRSLAECGLDGNGYRIETQRKWVRKCLPLAKALLVVVNIALKHVAGLSILIQEIAGVGGQSLDKVVSSMVEDAAEALTDSACSAVVQRLDEASATGENLEQSTFADGCQGVGNSNASRLPTQREASEMLEQFVRQLNLEGRKRSSPDHPFYCFDTTMRLVDKAGKGEDWSWVRKKNVHAFIA